ncbi:MAG: GNAT family N-acetyltransferase [Burkholderiaceae bacterium]|nr:GNAT family N-acetyltransferase [Burkholderiaceae bacterium]
MSLRWSVSAFDPGSARQIETWRALASEAGACSVLLPEFVFVCAAELASRPLAFAVCGSPDAPRAVALVDQRRSLLPEVFVADQMPLGAWVSLPDESFEELARSLVRTLGAGLRLGVSRIDSRDVPRLISGRAVATLDYIQTPWLELTGEFDGYWASRGKNLRTNMRRQREKLAATGVEARTELLTEPGAMAQAVRDYALLETRGWKAAGGTAVSERHPQTRFYARMLERFAERGFARVYRHLFAERLVATELCLHDGRELIILKTTYDQDCAPFSPASLMRQDMFESLFGDGATRRIEFYGPVMDWHMRWTSLRREIYHANFYRVPALRKVESVLRARALRASGGASGDQAKAG